MKTLFSMRAETNALFDSSPRGNPVTLTGNIKQAAADNLLQITKGYIETGPMNELGRGDSFTIEATVQPEKTTGGRQNIMEAQSPPVALFIDKDGFVNGSVNVAGAGWKAVKSKLPLQAGKSQHVIFSRDETGVLSLEIDGKQSGRLSAPGTLNPVGTQSFRIGTWIDGKTYQFKGTVGNIAIRSGVFTSTDMKQRITRARNVESILKSKLGRAAKVIVSPSLDESHSRLQPLKDIMNAVGVEKLSDLSTLKITVPTTITRGKVLVAPKVTPVLTIDWGSLAGNYTTLTPQKKKELLAKYMTNRNSTQTLRNASASPATATPAPGTITSGSLSGPLLITNRFTTRLDTLSTTNRTGLRIPREAVASNPTIEGLRMTTPISAHISLEKAALTVIDKDLLIRNLESKSPENLPQLSTAPRMLSIQVLPVNSSVIIAGTLDLTNTHLIIEPDVEKLYIIAEKVVCGSNARITWRKPGGSTPARLDDPGLNGRGYSGTHLKPGSKNGIDGEDGKPGSHGISGASGRNAPSLEMWVKNLTNIPTIDLNGEDGIRGGRGQKGGKGGSGANGKNGTYRWVWTPFGNIEWCDDEPGHGGDGGDGGRGGNGGRGGSGGSGGKIIIGVLDGTLAPTATAGQFHWKNQGGQKGRGGDPGQGGAGGRGGSAGYTTHCEKAKNGHNGAQGQPGSVGADGSYAGSDGINQFFEFSEDAWDDMLTRPWITEISPNEVFPGNSIKIKGSRFSNNDRVIIQGVATLVPVINPDESLTVTLPSNISGGTKQIYVKRAFDNTESNRIPVRVKPQLDTLPATLAPSAPCKITGRAFLPNASVLINGSAVPGTVNAPGTEISFTMIGTGGSGSSGGNVTVAVRNPDGLVSNARTASMPRVLEIPFTYGIHNLPFGNFKDGIPSWSTFEDTFGTAEVWHELLDPLFGHPILTGAYYGFYHYFLKGEDNGGLATGFCTALSCLVADKLWQGINDAQTTTKASIHKWATAVHGKLLSRESLIGFHDQGQQGVSRVEITARAIERTFMTGCDRNVAPLLFFIPSGSVWNAGYIDKLGSSHCIMPYRFIYPDGHPGPQLSPGGLTTVSSLDGVKLYCWDCNNPGSTDCRLEFRMSGGSLHYCYYPGGGAQFDSADGITLGLMSLGDYLHSDHDLPFSGPFGLTSFIIDFLLSPADIQITNENGLRVGNFSNMIFSEIPDSHPVYLAKGAYLLPTGHNFTRKFIGSGNGKYTFNSLMPDGTTIKLEDVATKPGQTDTLIISSDASQLRFTPHESKNFTLTYSRKVGDQMRALAISGLGAAPGQECDVTVSPDLSMFRLGNRLNERNITVQAFAIDKVTNLPVNKKQVLNLPVNNDLVVTVDNWTTVNLNVGTLSF